VKIQVEVFWVMMPCSFVVVYQCFGRLRCFHLEMEMEAARSFTSWQHGAWYMCGYMAVTDPAAC